MKHLRPPELAHTIPLALLVSTLGCAASGSRAGRMSHLRETSTVSAALALPSEASEPQVDPLPQVEARSTWALTFENDFFTGSDNNYTNGVGLSCLSGPVGAMPRGAFARRWTDFFSFLPFIDAQSLDTFVAWTVGQEMYTPDDITDPDPPLTDQPYAGVLFLDFEFFGKSDRACNAWRVRTGVVGPYSQADEVQKQIHEWIDDDIPQGWDTQLPNEPVLNVDFSSAFAVVNGGGGDGFGYRIVPTGNASLGTYFTGLSVGVYGEVGWNLGETVGLLNLRQGLDPVSLIVSGRENEPSINVHVGGGGFLVGHYLPLDGTVFRDSRSVDSEPLVSFLSMGVSVRLGRLSLNYLLSYFSDMFETQIESGEFGTATIAWSF